MISLILPYWDRQAAADAAIKALDRCYCGTDLEVVIVDDGNRVPFVSPACSLRVRVVNMPIKDEPKSPASCWNAGVAEASGDLIALSCIEVLHINPVLQDMAEELGRTGPMGYVLAAAWCPEMKEWHCHSRHHSEGAPAMPDGFGRAFLGMLHKSLYLKAGGWDEEYRDGAGWEDLDFAKRLQRAGAQPVIRDDLVVIHPKTGAKIRWGAAKFARNQAIYQQRWCGA